MLIDSIRLVVAIAGGIIGSAFAAETYGDLLGVGAVALGIVLIIAAAVPVFRAKSTQATIELLRTELDAEKLAREGQERRHAAEIAELRGRLSTLTPAFAKVIAQDVIAELRLAGVLNGKGSTS